MAVEDVTLYRAPTSPCAVDEVGDWLDDRIEDSVRVEERFLDRFGSDEVAEAFARARVHSPFERETGSTMYGILRYEERVLADPDRGGGVLYDGTTVQRALNQVLPEDEQDLSHLHIVFLDRVLATWGDHDGRWHKRIAVLGQPALISVPGLAEAPAKPDAYYQKKQQSAMVTGGAPPREILDAAIEDDVILKDDPRTTQALKGYALAAVNLIATGEEFCDDPDCRLSNPHRHEGVIRAQLEDPPFCSRHAARYA